MSLWILDTDTISLFQNQHSLVKQRVNQVIYDAIAVTVITVEEQMRGWLNTIRQSTENKRLIWGYLGLKQGVEFFNTIRVLDFGTQDLKIAATTIANNGILVTRNVRDFSRIPGLRFEDWSIED